MQRLAACLLMAVFSFLLIGPTLFAEAESGLPSCCRRDGKHHCAMMDMQGSSDAGPNLAGQRCSSFPKTPVVVAPAKAGLLKTHQAVFASVISHPGEQPQTEARFRISFSRASQKRGPPVFLS